MLDGVTVDGKPVRPAARDAAVPLLQAAGDAHRRARSQGAADDLRPAAAGLAAADAGRPARLHDRGAAAAHHRRRAEAPARAAAHRRRAQLSGARVRRGHPGAARGARRRHDDRGHPLRLDQRQSRAAHRPQLLDRDEPDRRQEPRGAPRARTSRPAGLAADPHRLRAARRSTGWMPARADESDRG